MKKELSSKSTFFVKIITPIICLSFWAITIFTTFFGTKGSYDLPLLMKFIFIAAGFLIGAILYFTVMKYMKVNVDNDFLYVNNYFKEIQIPLTNIAFVTEIIWARGHPVTIHLKTPSEFGKKFTSMPKSNGFKFLQPHPVVGELKMLAGLPH